RAQVSEASAPPSDPREQSPLSNRRADPLEPLAVCPTPPQRLRLQIAKRHVRPERGQASVKQRLLPALPKHDGETLRASNLRLPPRRIVGDLLDAAVCREHGRRALRPPSRQARDAIRRIPDQREPVRDQLRSHAEALP